MSNIEHEIFNSEVNFAFFFVMVILDRKYVCGQGGGENVSAGGLWELF